MGVTVLYFATPVTSILMNLASVQAFENFTMDDLKERFIRNEFGYMQKGKWFTKESQAVSEKFHKIANAEIVDRTGLADLPLEDLNMIHKLRIITALRIQNAHTYVQMMI